MDAISGVRKPRHCEGRIAAATSRGSRTCEYVRRDRLIPLQDSHVAHAPCCNRTMRRSSLRWRAVRTATEGASGRRVKAKSDSC